MTDTFFDFLMNTTNENFTASQNEIFKNSQYNPYSDDLSVIEGFLDQNDLTKAVQYNNVNVILSPRAHLYKNYAFEKLNQPKEAQAELIFAQKIMEGISLTGNGTKKKPYIVTRITDERDMLSYFQEEFVSQRLMHDDNTTFDVIQCKSGRELYFDITTPYTKMQDLMNNGRIENPLQNMSNQKPQQKKKWWQFWK
jgi:hypothetical protein